jgi:hypothetical protein
MSAAATVAALAGAGELLSPTSSSGKQVYHLFTATGRESSVEAPSLEQAAEMLRRAENYAAVAPDLAWLAGPLIALGFVVFSPASFFRCGGVRAPQASPGAGQLLAPRPLE